MYFEFLTQKSGEHKHTATVAGRLIAIAVHNKTQLVAQRLGFISAVIQKLVSLHLVVNAHRRCSTTKQVVDYAYKRLLAVTDGKIA